MSTYVPPVESDLQAIEVDGVVRGYTAKLTYSDGMETWTYHTYGLESMGFDSRESAEFSASEWVAREIMGETQQGRRMRKVSSLIRDVDRALGDLKGVVGDPAWDEWWWDKDNGGKRVSYSEQMPPDYVESQRALHEMYRKRVADAQESA